MVASRVKTKGKAVLEPLSVSVGWGGRLGEIVAILERGSPKNNLVPRPIRAQIDARLSGSRELARALARGDRDLAERVTRRLVRAVLEPGIRPPNRPSTAARKGGDRRATRNVRGRDAIYRQFRILVRKLKSGRFA